MTIAWTVDAGNPGLIVTVKGPLGLDDAGMLRLELMKCLAEQPDAVLIDLDGVRVEDPLALTVFPAVVRQAALWPGIPVVLCTSVAEMRGLLRNAADRRLPLFSDVESASRHVSANPRSLPVLSDDILPIEGAGRHARNMATEACLRWDLPDLVGPASLIANELVANVVVHANTMATLRISLQPEHLAIAVRDGASEAPVLRRDDHPPGRGLVLIEAMAERWGWLPSEGGKVVWAILVR